MKKIVSIILLSLASLTTFADSAENATKNNVIKKNSPYSVSETMDKFEAIIKKKGFDVFARIDHKKNAQSASMEMNPAQVLIFGNPKGGTLLMKQDINVALDLPLRVAVYKDADNHVIIAYHNPVMLTTGYNLTGHKVIEKVAKGLDKLTSVAIAQ